MIKVCLLIIVLCQLYNAIRTVFIDIRIANALDAILPVLEKAKQTFKVFIPDESENKEVH